MQNKKISNASINVYNGITFKSKLEVMIYKTLQEQGFDVKYEPKKFIIWEGYRPTVPFFDKNLKTGLLKQNTKKLIDVTYTPDFCFEYNDTFIIIEAKGFENDVFPLKKKMFRKLLESLDKPVLYFEIYSKKQLLQAIEIIKNYGNNN